ncbi:MAG TPA: AraC family transcriptional regulator [Planctomycetota bacterium]
MTAGNRSGARSPGAGLSSDTLSDLLRTVRLTGAVFFDIEAAAPWAEMQPPGPTIARSVLPGVQHLISYHVVTSGHCFGGRVGDEPVRLEAGDVIVFPHGDAHVMSSAPNLPARVDLDHYRQPSSQLPVTLRVDGNPGERSHLVCGFLGCDVRPFNPLINALPRVLLVRHRAGPDGGWLGQFIQVALAESRTRRSGGESVLARISELMFVEAVRRHLESLPADRTGWLAGLRDPHVGKALACLHARPAFGWTLAALAREAGLSRTALAERFAHLVGQPPMQYLTNWRMQVATASLVRGDKVGSVAFDVGYDSEAAFSRAFKRLVGRSPAAWRSTPRSA